MKSAGNRIKLAGLVTAVGLVSLFAAVNFSTAQGGQSAEGKVSTVNKEAEKIKTLSIGKKASSNPEVVMSIPADKLGGIQDGDRIEGSMEFEVTICLKAPPRFPQKPCVGSIYGYNPKVTAQIVLAPSGDATNPNNTFPVSKKTSLNCSQKQPNVNRHCVLALRPSGKLIDDASALPCNQGDCHMNVVASASHGSAQRGDKVVIGSSDDDRDIQQNRGSLNGLRLRPGNAGKPDPLISRQREVKAIKVVNENANEDTVVVYSVALRNVKAGDQFYMDSLLQTRISNLNYNARFATQVIVADSPRAIKTGQIANRSTQFKTEIGKKNGLTCTQGSSGHKGPCTIRKVGAVIFERDAEDTVYLNLISESEAQINQGQNYRPGSKAAVSKKGFIRAYRFDPPN